MTVDEALKLRELWKDLKDPPCEHGNLELERTSAGQLTGGYVCTRCGAVVFRLKPPDDHGGIIRIKKS